MNLNVQKALNDKNITMRAVAQLLGVTEKTIQNKIQGDTDFSFPEAMKIKRELLPEYDYDYLFARDDQQAG